MSRLTYPADEAADRVEVISEALSRQADMLSAVTERAAEQAQLLRDVLEDHTTRLEKASDIAGVRAGQAQTVTQRVSETFRQQSDGLVETTKEAVARVEESSETLCRRSMEVAQSGNNAAEQHFR